MKHRSHSRPGRRIRAYTPGIAPTALPSFPAGPRSSLAWYFTSDPLLIHCNIAAPQAPTALYCLIPAPQSTRKRTRATQSQHAWSATPDRICDGGEQHGAGGQLKGDIKRYVGVDRVDGLEQPGREVPVADPECELEGIPRHREVPEDHKDEEVGGEVGPAEGGSGRVRDRAAARGA